MMHTSTLIALSLSLCAHTMIECDASNFCSGQNLSIFHFSQRQPQYDEQTLGQETAAQGKTGGSHAQIIEEHCVLRSADTLPELVCWCVLCAVWICVCVLSGMSATGFDIQSNGNLFFDGE